MSIRLTEDRHDWLRRLAFDRRTTMQQIIDEALDQYRASPAARDSADRISA